MDSDYEFEERINAIHRPHNPVRESPAIGETTMDVRHEEFQAMADAFLGEDFDKSKLAQVESLQIALHEYQVVFFKRYQNGELRPEEYVDHFNYLLAVTFEACESILGAKEFIHLFGVPPSEIIGFIDKDAFLEQHYTQHSQRYAEAE